VENTVIVIGNPTADPDLAYTPNGTALCRLGVAVTRREQDGGEPGEDDGGRDDPGQTESGLRPVCS
jgi:single-stranded DNA-binding protein